jgi:hypothetical protein
LKRLRRKHTNEAEIATQTKLEKTLPFLAGNQLPYQHAHGEETD